MVFFTAVKAAEQLRAAQVDEHFRREVLSLPVPDYRSPTAAACARLERETRALHPNCPYCGGRLVGTSAEGGEEGADDDGNTVISMVLWCENVDNDEEASAGSEIPHPLTHRMVEHELALTSR